MIDLSPLTKDNNKKKPLSETFELQNSKPSILNTAGKIITGIGGFAKDVLLEAPARAAASLTMQVTGQEKLTPTSSIEKFVLGEEDVKKFSTMVSEAGKTGEDLFVGEGAKTFGSITGKGLAIGLVALDLTPFGGVRKNLVKELTSLKDVKKIEVVLKNAGVSDDLIAVYAPKFSKTNKSKEVSEGLKSLENIIKETKTSKTGTQIVKGIDNNLIQEAKKYKSADEFIKSQREPLYHGTNKDFEKFELTKGKREGFLGDIREVDNQAIFLTKDKELASFYGKNKVDIFGGDYKLIESYTDTGKILDLSNVQDKEIKKLAIELMEKYDGKVRRKIPKDLQYQLVDKKEFVDLVKEKGFDTIKINEGKLVADGIKKEGDNYTYAILNPEKIKTKQQLTDIWNKAKAIKDTSKEIISDIKPESFTSNAVEIGATNRLPTIIRGETFTFSGGLKPSTSGRLDAKEAFKQYKIELKATEKEIKNAIKAEEKALKLIDKQRVIRETTLTDFQKHTKGSSEKIINNLKKRFLSDEDIDNIILENGDKLNDVLKVQRNADGSLRSVIKKSDIENIKKSYTGVKPESKWIEKSNIAEIIDKSADLTRGYELPRVFFERKGLKEFIYDPMIDAARGAEILKNSYINRFKEAGLWKDGGWFTADRFKISKSESENISKYYLSRQGKGFPSSTFNSLSKKEQRFVRVFDSIIQDSSPRFYEVAKKNGLTPGVIDNYAPIATKKELQLTETESPMEWLMRNHPSF